MAADSNETQTLMAPQEVCELMGWHREQLKRARAAGGFPEPLDLVQGGRLPIWEAKAVREWKAAQEAALSARS